MRGHDDTMRASTYQWELGMGILMAHETRRDAEKAPAMMDEILNMLFF